MKKKIRIHLKTEKVIVKLLYKKGLLEEDLSDIGWEYFSKYGMKRRRKRNGRKYRISLYLPELFVFSTDYWGEGIETPVVNTHKHNHWYNTSKNLDEDNYPLDKELSKKNFIKYLRSLPNKRNDNKINKILKVITY